MRNKYLSFFVKLATAFIFTSAIIFWIGYAKNQGNPVSDFFSFVDFSGALPLALVASGASCGLFTFIGCYKEKEQPTHVIHDFREGVSQPSLEGIHDIYNEIDEDDLIKLNGRINLKEISVSVKESEEGNDTFRNAM